MMTFVFNMIITVFDEIEKWGFKNIFGEFKKKELKKLKY